MSEPQHSAEAEFLMQLGAALHNWQLVEMALCNLLTTVMRSPDPRLGAEMFYAVVNFRDKLAMVDSALRFTLWRHKRLVPEWDKLCERTRKRSGRRNAIVHGHLATDGDEYSLTEPVTLLSIERGKAKPQAASIDIKEIRECCRSFRLLSRHIREFDEQVREFLTLRQG